MLWDILKIEPTKDKKAITRAYRDLLSGVNPEEKPEEFKLLRNAYEEALAYADREEEPEAEKTPVDLWVDELNALYMELPRRLDVAAWRDLFSEEICIALDTRPLIEEAMLHYFLENFRIPHAVWQYLEEEFRFLEREEELKAAYPEGFVRYIIVGGITEEDSFPMELFPEGTDGAAADEYIRAYYELSNTNFDEAGPLFEQFNLLSVRHPYGDALCLRYAYSQGDASAIDRMKELCTVYPGDKQLKLQLMVGLYQAKCFNEALRTAEELLEKGEKNATVLRVKAYSLAELENYKDALETLTTLVEMAGGNQRVVYDLEQSMAEWNDKLIENYEKQLADGTTDPDVPYDLAWAYLQNEKTEKAVELLPKLTENHPSEDKYLRLCFYTLSRSGKTEEALNAVDRLIEATENAATEDPEEIHKNEQRIMSTMLEKCQLLFTVKRKADAVEEMKNVRARFFDNAEAITRLTQLSLQQRMYPEALENARRITQILPDSYHGYVLCAIACFNMHRDNEAFSAINAALDLDGSDLYAYLLKLRILVRNDAFEPAQQLIDFLAENGITDDITIKWCKAQMLAAKEDERQCEETNKEKAYTEYKSIEKELETMEDRPEWVADFYYNMAVLLANVKDARGDYSRTDILELLEKGIAADPECFDCIEYKAWLLRKEDHFDESLALYKKLEAMPRNNHYIETQLADMYSDDAYHSAGKALEYYKLLEEEQGDTYDYHQVVGYLHYKMKNFGLADESFDKALTYAPEDPWLYYRKSCNYMVDRKLNKALDAARKALELHRSQAADDEHTRSFYWQNVATILLLQNRTSEAVAIYEDCRKHCKRYADYWKNITNALGAAGRFREVDNYMALWKKSGEQEKDYYDKLILLEIVHGNGKNVPKLLKKYEKKLDHDEFVRLSAISNALRGDFSDWASLKKQVLDRRYTKKDEGGLVDSYASSAFGHWLNKEYKLAREEAEAGVRDAEQSGKVFSLYEPIHYGALAQCLAILGRFDEARETVSEMNSCSLCESCRFHVCKDYYLYCARIETMCGNYDEALRYLKELEQADPTEEDRLILEAYLKTKGK